MIFLDVRLLCYYLFSVSWCSFYISPFLPFSGYLTIFQQSFIYYLSTSLYKVFTNYSRDYTIHAWFLAICLKSVFYHLSQMKNPYRYLGTFTFPLAFLSHIRHLRTSKPPWGNVTILAFKCQASANSLGREQSILSTQRGTVSALPSFLTVRVPPGVICLLSGEPLLTVTSERVCRQWILSLFICAHLYFVVLTRDIFTEYKR